MPLVQRKPTTPGQRFLVRSKTDLSKKRPERKLSRSKKRTGGRNVYGRITSRRRGGGHKKLYRIIDFKRDKYDIPARVQAIEYDPNRSANIALLAYADGEKRYILAPRGVAVGDTLLSSKEAADFKPGNNMALSAIPPSSKVHAIELEPGKGAQIARSAGVAAQLVGIDGGRATLKMPSGEIRMVNAKCRATMGEVGNSEHNRQTIGKAGRNRWLGRRPRVRGMAMNPVDHPGGGGEGRSKSGGGRQHPMSPWSQLSKGFPTRSKSKLSNKMILIRRTGLKVKH